ncbi:DNA primase [Streptomyces sp. NPDC059009]|uniref:DNA primase n=1 Tax=Streptomyces sp. NPDC059009 TaxID=3346694 RepID=UPI0036BA939E
MNRLGLGLAVGAGYVLGRTKKAKLAFAVGTLVAGRKLSLDPKAIGTFVSRQLAENPQFKEIGDQLREDVRGVGKAATGSLVTRQMDSLADRLHDRTLGVQDRLAGVVPGGEASEDEEEDEEEGKSGKAEGPEDASRDSGESGDSGDSGEADRSRRRAPKAATSAKPAKSTSAKTAKAAKPAKSAVKSAPRSAQRAPAKKTTARSAPARRKPTSGRASERPAARSKGARSDD